MKRAFPVYILLTIGPLSVAGCAVDGVTKITNSQPVIDRLIVPEEVKNLRSTGAIYMRSIGSIR